MAVPAGHVGRAVTAEGFVAQRDVLECLVERGADVDVAVGEGRTVVENKRFLRLDAILLESRVKSDAFPVRDAAGFALSQTCAHGEICFRKLEGVFQVLRHTGKRCGR